MRWQHNDLEGLSMEVFRKRLELIRNFRLGKGLEKVSATERLRL